MKNALLRYDSKGGRYKNIGDYIQSVAAKQFTGDEVILIEREHLHAYDGEPVRLIMAAWWMHYPEHWPPSKKIDPLFISFHVTPDKAERMLSKPGVEYLKNYEPIGCRDKGTQRLLEAKGIKTYFSGCITLTLGRKYRYNPVSGKAIFVDPHFDALKLTSPTSLVKALWTLIIKYNDIKTISLKMYKLGSLRSLLKTAAFYRIYIKQFTREVLLSSDYYTHSVYEPSFKNEQEKFDYSDQLLTAYSKANFVVTSRLHVSLPTIAMGVPTIFVQSDKIPRSRGRFEGLLEHVNCIEYKNSRWEGIEGFTAPERIGNETQIFNKNTHVETAEKLSAQCVEFAGWK